jgi:hypothetical protein
VSPISAPVTSAALLLKIAASYDWVREEGGQNKGQAVAHFLEEVNLHDPEPWCAAFVSTVGIDAFGADWPLPRLASCQMISASAKAKGLLYPYPVPGAVFLLWSDQKQRFHHTGFVAEPAPDAGAFWTIEGNTNLGGSPEGIGVFRRTRKFSRSDRFVWWWGAS